MKRERKREEVRKNWENGGREGKGEEKKGGRKEGKKHTHTTQLMAERTKDMEGLSNILYEYIKEWNTEGP